MLHDPRDPFGPSGKDRFDAGAYPKAYVTPVGWRVFLFVLGAVALGFAVTVNVSVVSHPPKETEGWLILIVVLTIIYLFAIHVLFYAIRSRFVLYADAIEVRGAWCSGRLQFEDILGRRMLYPAKDVPKLVLVPREIGGRTLKVPLWADPDIAFRAWVTRLPDLDAKDETHS